MKLQADYNCYLTEAAEVALTERNFYDVVAIINSDDAKNWRQIDKAEYDNYQAQIAAINFEPSFEYLQQLQVANATTEEKIQEMNLPAEQALQVQSFYPIWGEGKAKFGTEVQKGFRLRVVEKESDVLYEVMQTHTLQEGWKPGVSTASLYKVVDVEHEGTKEDPIPYNEDMNPEFAGMTLEMGKFYIQGGIIYECIESTGIPVYANLSELARYVKVAE